MIHIFDNWVRSSSRPEKDFLIMGKGPSLELEPRILRSKYISIGLNHVSAKYEVDIAHVIDLEVINDCGELIYKNAKYLLMPWHPNMNFAPHLKNISVLLCEFEVINKFAESGRLLIYNRLNGASQHPAGGTVVLPRYFSGDTVFQLLSKLGEKKVYSIGLDGGSSYSIEFSSLVPLQNGQKTFDDQFLEISEIERISDSKLIKLGDLEPINVFVGLQEEQRIPALVLKDSIMHNTHHPVSFNLLCDNLVDFKTPNDPNNRPRTPFSFQRFMIPSLTNGKAFYLDSDMQVFGDMADLLKLDFEDSEVIACYGMEIYGHWKGSQYAVLMLDCSKIRWNIHTLVQGLDSGQFTYEDLMFKFAMAKVAHKIPPSWNSLDLYNNEGTNLIHYTDMSRQPWKHSNHPFESIWVSGLERSIKNKIIALECYESACKLGHVKINGGLKIDKVTSVKSLIHDSKRHVSGVKYRGDSVKIIQEIASRIKVGRIIDCGCASETFQIAFPNIDVIAFDPLVAGFDILPKPADMVYCVGVLEYIELDLLDNALYNIKILTGKIGIFVVEVDSGGECDSNDKTVQRTVKNLTWWSLKIKNCFIIMKTVSNGNGVIFIVRPNI